MKTTFKKRGDTVVVLVEGRLNVEAQEPLRRKLQALHSTSHTDQAATKFIFDLKGLEFVGSSGISSFVQTLKDFGTTTSSRPRYCNVQSEFQRVIRAFDDEDMFEFFENEAQAKSSFDN